MLWDDKDNIVVNYIPETDEVTIKLIDFGDSDIIKLETENEYRKDYAGTVSAFAPECFSEKRQNKQLFAIDTWACGLILLFFVFFFCVLIFSV